MDPIFIKKGKRDKSITAHFELNCKTVIAVTAQWYDNDGDKWTYDVVIDELSVAFGYMRTAFNLDAIKAKIIKSGGKASQQEVLAIYDFLLDHQTTTEPSISAHESHYGV